MLAPLMDSMETIIRVHHVFKTVCQKSARIAEYGSEELHQKVKSSKSAALK
jgi:hypothetical protein